MKKVLVISAHADDEAFGMGGTLLRFASKKKFQLYWLIATRIWEPKWSEQQIQMREQAIKNVNKLLRFKEIIRWSYKDNLLDTISKNELQEKLIEVLDDVKPQIIFTPSIWDFNFEHRLIFEIVEMSTKPYYSRYVEEIIAYEIPSSTEASFDSTMSFPANLYYDIEIFFEKKNQIMSYYGDQLHQFPHPRSLEYVGALATIRGGESGLRLAEGFHLLRSIRK